MKECDKCKGSGKLTIYEDSPSGDVKSVRSELCECRASLPRRHGKATWWDCGKGVTESWSPGWWLKVTVTLRQEVPISEDCYPLHRTLRNSYFCTTPEIEVDGFSLNSVELREAAAFLNRMADKADRMDEPVPDPVEGGTT